jgi:FixJ family two-component response regulator
MLIESVGLNVQTFQSAQDFLCSQLPDEPRCLVLDVRLAGLSGFDLQNELAEMNVDIPTVFITGYGDVPLAVRAMKAGAIEFLTKPFRDQDLLDAISLALRKDRAQRVQEAQLAGLRRHYLQLTPREREVMELIVAGMLNKQIAAELGACEATIKIHRAHVMQKMGVTSVAELVRIADRLGDRSPRSPLRHTPEVVEQLPKVLV